MGTIKFADFIKKNQSEILLGAGAAGMIATTIMAVRATPKAIILLGRRKEELGVEKLGIAETIKTAWKPYLPALLMGSASTACIIGAGVANRKRTAALATAYILTETSLLEYKDKVKEVIGEAKHKEIEEKVAIDKMEKDPVSSTEVIILPKGDTLCYDADFKRYFKSDVEKIRQAKDKVNTALCSGQEEFVSLNDFFYELGMEGIKLGDDIGWHAGRGHNLEIIFGSQLADDGTPCLAFKYSHIEPKINPVDYSKY